MFCCYRVCYPNIFSSKTGQCIFRNKISRSSLTSFEKLPYKYMDRLGHSYLICYLLPVDPKELHYFHIGLLVCYFSCYIFRHYLSLGEEEEFWSLGSSFKTGANFTSICNALVLIFMTVFVQAAIKFFSSKWHLK